MGNENIRIFSQSKAFILKSSRGLKFGESLSSCSPPISKNVNYNFLLNLNEFFLYTDITLWNACIKCPHMGNCLTFLFILSGLKNSFCLSSQENVFILFGSLNVPDYSFASCFHIPIILPRKAQEDTEFEHPNFVS